MDNISWITGIVAFMALILSIFTIIHLGKKYRKNQKYEQFFDDRNIKFDELKDSNKLIFQEKEKGKCPKCGRDNIDLIVKTGLCINCTYHPLEVDKEWYEENFNIININSMTEKSYELDNININELPNIGIFSIKGTNNKTNKTRILDIYQGKKIKKEIQNIIKKEGKYSILNNYHDITINIINFNLSEDDMRNIMNILYDMKENSSFLRQIIQMQYAHENIPEFWHPNAGDQNDIIKNCKNNKGKEV